MRLKTRRTNMPSSIKNLSVSYLWYKAITDQEKASLSLELLTNNAVGIGDHSTGDFHKNLDETLDALVDARDRLETLQELYPELVD
tara:strand:- start:1257 stop:1514 length:258 start_codon:yes stop_codon:yes gene_type:complete